MKKLLIALTVASLAALSQAVTLHWNYEGAGDWIADISTGALVYSATGTDIDDALAAARNKTTDTSSSYYVVSQSDSSNENRWIASPDAGSYASTADATYNKTGTYFIVLFDEADTATADYAIVGVEASATEKAWTVVGASTVIDTPLTNLQFTGTLVPEPTVLALLALGVAGLALRRKA